MARDICCVCAKSVIPSEFAQRRNELRKIMDDLHIKLKENALMCPPCLEKIDKIYNFKMSFLKSKNNIMVENSAILNNLNKTSRNGALEEDLHNQNIRICRLCKTSNVDSVSYRDFLENNNMQSIYGDHFPEIKFHYSKHWVICKNCINGLKDFMDIKLKLNIDKPSVHNPNQEGKQKQLFVRLVNLNLSTHMRKTVKYERGNRPPRKIYKCEICSFKTRNIQKHRRFHKDLSELTNYKCSECSFVTKYLSGLKRHLKRHQQRAEAPMKIKMLNCEYCSFKTLEWKAFNKHIRTHPHITFRDMFHHKCPHCNYGTDKKFSFELHMRKHQPQNNKGKIKCDICNYWTRLETHLRRHMTYHNIDDMKK